MRTKDVERREKQLVPGAIDEILEGAKKQMTRSRRSPEPHEEIAEAMVKPDQRNEETVLPPVMSNEIRVLIVERASSKFRISVPANLEITFSVISARRENRYGPDESGRDLRFYATGKVLVAVLTGVTDVYPEGVLQIEQWNPKLTRKSTLTEDNSGSKSSNETTITGDWEPVPFSVDRSGR